MRKIGAFGLSLFLVLAAGCAKKPAADNEKHITMHYKGTLQDGSVFDSSEGKDPLKFVFGVGMMLPSLETGIKGMKAGDRKTVEIKAEDAYGPYRDDLVQAVPRKNFPSDITPTVGMQLMAQTMFGPMPVKIKDMTEKEIFVDYNAPLAGKDLTFAVEIVEVRDSTEEELAPFKKPADSFDPSKSGTLPPLPEKETPK